MIATTNLFSENNKNPVQDSCSIAKRYNLWGSKQQKDSIFGGLPLRLGSCPRVFFSEIEGPFNLSANFSLARSLALPLPLPAAPPVINKKIKKDKKKKSWFLYGVFRIFIMFLGKIQTVQLDKRQNPKLNWTIAKLLLLGFWDTSDKFQI